MKIINIVGLAAFVGTVAAVSRRSPKKRARGSVVVDEPEVELVPPPSQAAGAMTGSEVSAKLGPITWWIAPHGVKFGWEWQNADGTDGEVSYLDGQIYHYPSAEAALNDLLEVIS